MLTHHTDDPLVRLAVDKTRRRGTQGPALAAAHRDVGKLLARDIAKNLPLENCSIDHSTGQSIGVRVRLGGEPIIIALMRSGLFLAEGIWEMLPQATLLPWLPTSDLPLDIHCGRPIVLVDAVINTGRSIRRAIDLLKDGGHSEICVVALTGYAPTLTSLALQEPRISFIAARMSDHSYVGHGKTDTGTRLFGDASTC